MSLFHVQFTAVYGQVHANRVLYRDNPQPGHRYRQIAVVEKDQFEVRIFEGDVVQTEPQFVSESSDAEVHFHPTLNGALAQVEEEFRGSAGAGWVPYKNS